ncbi:MAG: Dinoroseobacter phage vB DshS-R5C [Pseudomonadota bacterium]
MSDIAITIEQPAALAATIEQPAPIALQLTIGQGPAGPASDQGNGGADAHYEHSQTLPDTTWTINHGLNKFPAVAVFDSAGDEVEGATAYPNANTVVLTFSAAFSGTAYLN